MVADVDKVQDSYESIGIGPWQDHPPLSAYAELQVPNEAAFGSLRFIFADLSNIRLQLCQTGTCGKELSEPS